MDHDAPHTGAAARLATSTNNNNVQVDTGDAPPPEIPPPPPPPPPQPQPTAVAQAVGLVGQRVCIPAGNGKYTTGIITLATTSSRGLEGFTWTAVPNTSDQHPQYTFTSSTEVRRAIVHHNRAAKTWLISLHQLPTSPPLLTRLGYRILPAAPDGDCCYHAVGQLLSGRCEPMSGAYKHPDMMGLRDRTFAALDGPCKAAFLPSNSYTTADWDGHARKSAIRGMRGMASEVNVRGLCHAVARDILILNWDLIPGHLPGTHRRLASLFPCDLNRLPGGVGLGLYSDPMFLSFPTDDDLVNYLLHDKPVTTPFGGLIPARGSREPPLILVYGGVHFDSVVPIGDTTTHRAPGTTTDTVPTSQPPLGSDGNVESCSACGERGILVCCDNCPAAYHCECAELLSVPEGHWFCADCAAPGPSIRPTPPSHTPTHRAGPAGKPFMCKANGCSCSYRTLEDLGRHINGVSKRPATAAHQAYIDLGPEAYKLIACRSCTRWCKQGGLTKHSQNCCGFSPPPMPSNAARRRAASPPPSPDRPGGSGGPTPARPYTLAGKAHAAFARWAQSSNPLDFIIANQLQTKCNFKVETEKTASLFIDIVDGLIAAVDDPAAEALLFFLPFLLWTPCEGNPKRSRQVMRRRIERFLEGDLEGLLSDARFLRNTKSAQKPKSTAGSKSDDTRFRLASQLVQVGAISRGNQQLVSKGMLEDHGPSQPGAESDLQRRIRSKFPVEPHRPVLTEISGPFPAFNITVEDLRSDDGAFGPRMPRMKAAGLDGWRLEHVAQLVVNSEPAAACFTRLIAWITSDHAPGKGPTSRFMAFYGTMRVLPFRKELLSPDPRPVVVPSGLCRSIERVLDTKFREAYVHASGPFQFGYNAPAGTEQAVQLVRLAREVLDLPVTVLWDASNAFPTCSNSDTLEALAEDDELRALVPYFTRCFGSASARATGHLPEILYYGAGRGGNEPREPTMRLAKIDGLGQGNVTSTGNYNITANRALRALRESTKDDGIMSAFIDDLTSVYPANTALDQFDKTLAASESGSGNKMNWDKIKVILPPPRDDAERGIVTALIAGFLGKGVKRANIISDDTPSAERGAKLLGAPVGHPDFAEALVRKRGRQLEENSWPGSARVWPSRSTAGSCTRTSTGRSRCRREST